MTCSKYFKVSLLSRLHRQVCPSITQSTYPLRFQSTSSNVNLKSGESIPSHKEEEVSYARSSELFKRIDWDYITNGANKTIIEENLKRRKLETDFKKLLSLYEQVISSSESTTSPNLINELVTEALKLPNSTHPNSLRCAGDNNNVIHRVGNKVEGEEFLEFKKGAMAELESALIKFTVDGLLKHGFELISVPDILYPNVIESCGFSTKGPRNQVYFVDVPNEDNREACLSGTAEMAIAGFLQNKTFNFEELPLKLAAVSRCYRAEISGGEDESGLFRVHAFTKVEMFGVTSNEDNGNESNELQENFLSIQEDLFKQCQLHFQTLEMAPFELGSSAHRKFDIEAWMPGRKMYGEISSCSNCTDYQSRRHNIRYKKDGHEKFAHTINGTACAIPRMLISLVETFQTSKGLVELPEAIKKFMPQSWESANNQPVESNFLRTKSQQDRVTAEYS